MEPIIKEENKIYAIGYSYATDWPKLCRTVDRAAYWSVTDFSNMDQSAYAKIEDKNGEEIAFLLCKETGDFEMRFFFGKRVECIGNVPNGMEALEIPAAKYAVFTLDSKLTDVGESAYVQEIKNLWQYIFEEWFPQSGYRHDDMKCNFEVYSGDVMQIYVPVCKK
ncbi:MAG: GyrI-like domain-containing protein [Oscillospiraceae bacterium]|nr:GyrI-like domain-containing protein [Oscillospiraceae bacterium]